VLRGDKHFVSTAMFDNVKKKILSIRRPIRELVVGVGSAIPFLDKATGRSGGRYAGTV